MQEYIEKLERNLEGVWIVPADVNLRGVARDMDIGDVIEVPAERYNVLKATLSDEGFIRQRKFSTMRMAEQRVVRATRTE